MNELTKGSKFTYIDSNNKTILFIQIIQNVMMEVLSFMLHHTYLMKMIEY